MRLIGLLLLFLVGFGRSIYGHIPIEVGGGNPKQVILVPKAEAVNYMNLSGIKFTTATSESLGSLNNSIVLSAPQKLLLATEKEYIILVENDSMKYAVSIDANLIELIVYSSKSISISSARIVKPSADSTRTDHR